LPHLRALHSFPTRRSSDLTHVRDVEDPACVANGEVLGGHALVLHRHLEACELHQLGPGVAMALEERRAREQRPLLRGAHRAWQRSEEHTSELQSLAYLVCR